MAAARSPRAPRRRRAPRPRASGKRRARLAVDVRRSQLLALGLEAFSARAYDEVGVGEIARAARISKGLLYHYFPTKRDFYVAALALASRRLLAETITPPGSAPPEARLRRGLEKYLDFVGKHGPSYVALIRGGVGSDPAVAAVVDRTRRTFVRRILEGIETAPPAAPGTLVRLAVRGWIGFVEATAIDWLGRRGRSRAGRDAVVGLALRVLLDAVRAAADGPVAATRQSGRK